MLKRVLVLVLSVIAQSQRQDGRRISGNYGNYRRGRRENEAHSRRLGSLPEQGEDAIPILVQCVRSSGVWVMGRVESHETMRGPGKRCCIESGGLKPRHDVRWSPVDSLAPNSRRAGHT